MINFCINWDLTEQAQLMQKNYHAKTLETKVSNRGTPLLAWLNLFNIIYKLCYFFRSGKE